MLIYPHCCRISCTLKSTFSICEIWLNMTRQLRPDQQHWQQYKSVTGQVVGSEVDDVLQQFTDVQRYCRTSCGQNIHDILDHINTALAVSCVNFLVLHMLCKKFWDIGKCNFRTCIAWHLGVYHCRPGTSVSSLVHCNMPIEQKTSKNSKVYNNA